MAGWKGYGDWLKKVQDSGYYFSDYDLQRAAEDQNFADQAFRYKENYARATSQEEKDAAHAGMEELRAGTQYSGGADGSEYNPWETKKENPLPSYITDTPTYTYDTPAPKYSGAYDDDIKAAADRILGSDPYSSRYSDDIDAIKGKIVDRDPYSSKYAGEIDTLREQIKGRGDYVSPYDGYIQDAVSKILNREPFSYDHTVDPVYSAYKKEYTREGRRASEDMLGQMAAMTGGMPSTAAVTAASQAGDYYSAKLADKIPELYKAAYSMYQDEGNRMIDRVNMLRGLDSDAYGRWGDEGDRMLQQLSILQGLDDTDYRRWSDEDSRMLQQMGLLQELDDTEYRRWNDARTRQQEDLDMLRAMDNDAYKRYLTDLGQYNTDREFDRDVYENDRNFDWQKSVDQRNFDRDVYENDRNFDYETEQDRQARELALAQLGISLGDYSGAQALGINTDDAVGAVYAYGSGEPYRITSTKGKAFITDAQPGQTMTGGDGSIWTKNADGSVTITKGESEWKIEVPAAAAGSFGGGYAGGYGGGTGEGSGDGSDAVTAFQNGDHSDATIKALLDQGFTQADIEGAGYTGDYFSRQSGGGGEKNASGLGPQAQHVYETIMNQVVYGGSAADAMAFAEKEIEKGMANGSIDEDEADYILRLFGY